MDALTTPPWTCPSCGSAVTTPFCGTCGEQRLAPGDLSLRHYFAATAESLLSWDGRILGTIASFVRRPGELTAAYLEGRRKPFLNPLQLFLLINVLYFLQQGVTHWTTYNTPFGMHVNQSDYMDVARPLARWRLDQLGIPYEGPLIVAYAKRFDAATALTAKSLLILMVPIVTLLVVIVRLGRPRLAAVHLTVGLHLTAYLLALQTVLLPLASAVQWGAGRMGMPMSPATQDTVVTWAINVALGAISGAVFQRAYGGARWVIVLQAVAMAWFNVDCLKLYRFLMFVVTLLTTS